MAKDYGWRFWRKGYAIGKKDPAKFWTPDEYVRLMNISHDAGVKMAERAKLLRRGQAGDQEALNELRLRYRLRLPLVEARLKLETGNRKLVQALGDLGVLAVRSDP